MKNKLFFIPVGLMLITATLKSATTSVEEYNATPNDYFLEVDGWRDAGTKDLAVGLSPVSTPPGAWVYNNVSRVQSKDLETKAICSAICDQEDMVWSGRWAKMASATKNDLCKCSKK